MDPKWFPPPNRPLRHGALHAIAANSIGIVTLLLPPGPFRSVIGIPPILWIAYNLRQYSCGKSEIDYLDAANVFIGVMRYLDFCVLHVPERVFCRVGAENRVEAEKDVQNMTLWRKLHWNFDLFMTWRGVGWNWKVKNVDEVPKDMSRGQFVVQQIIRAGYCFALMDMHDWYFHRTFSLNNGSISPEFFSLPFGRQVLLAWSSAFNNGCTMAFGYNLMTAVVVASGLSRPQAWPPMFGSLRKKGYSMRNVWGYCWHQLHRRSFETANSFLIRMLRIKKGTVASRLLQLCNAFFLSAILHHVGSLNQPYSDMVWCQFAFFLMQPVAITIEDLAISLGRSIGLKENRKRTPEATRLSVNHSDPRQEELER
ncbi:hypothetical protein H2202_009706 [Exophiala xenobiotica]|nr:hypothetical protein H2202_009706 [Exophiala xenobiotica]